MAQHAGIDPASIKLVNVNFQLTSALLAGQVDAVIGGYRNYRSTGAEAAGQNAGSDERRRLRRAGL